MAEPTRRQLLSATLGFGRSKASRSQRTLVVVFLRGGADGLNMIVPHGDPDYGRLRPALAIAPPGSPQGCLDLDGFFGLHPALAPLRPLYQEGRLAPVVAVGSDDHTRSHFEAQDQMEQGAARGQSLRGGWLGRLLRGGGRGASLAAVAVGSRIPESLRGAPTAAAMTSLGELQLRGVDGQRRDIMRALGDLYAEPTELGRAARDTLALSRRVEALAIGDEPSETEAGPSAKELERGLRDVARLVTADVGLQVACLDHGGWDTHFVQGGATGLHADRMSELASSLARFDRELGAHRQRVVTVVMTEFGRRAHENASLGTDHGRGSVMLVLGDGVRGGSVYGRWPGLSEAALVGPGDIAVTTDYRSVLSDVVAHLGTAPTERVFPAFERAPLHLFS